MREHRGFFFEKVRSKPQAVPRPDVGTAFGLHKHLQHVEEQVYPLQHPVNDF